MVERFRPEHAAQVAALHCSALPGLLSALGPWTATVFYRGALTSPRCLAFVDEHQGAVRGFVFGSSEPEELRRDILRARPLRILLGSAASVLRKPSVLRLFASGVTGGSFDPRAPELTYLAVREEARGAGVGRALLAAFAEDLRARGVARYELSVEGDNRAAVDFYQAQGLRETGTYRQFDKLYRRLALEMVPAKGLENR